MIADKTVWKFAEQLQAGAPEQGAFHEGQAKNRAVAFADFDNGRNPSSRYYLGQLTSSDLADFVMGG